MELWDCGFVAWKIVRLDTGNRLSVRAGDGQNVGNTAIPMHSKSCVDHVHRLHDFFRGDSRMMRTERS